jgi:hypothetical protein
MATLILIPTVAKDSFLHTVQTGYEVRPAYYTVGNKVTFPGSKAAGA